MTTKTMNKVFRGDVDIPSVATDSDTSVSSVTNGSFVVSPTSSGATNLENWQTLRCLEEQSLNQTVLRSKVLLTYRPQQSSSLQ